MPKLRFDPVTYQFYFRCPPEDGAPAKAAGFGWDAIRRRYYTEDPMVAVGFESCSDNYVKLLLADVLGTGTSYQNVGRVRRSSKWVPPAHMTGIPTSTVH